MPETASHSEARTIAASPSTIMAALTQPAVIARWAPVAFDVESTRPLRAGSTTLVSGGLAGRRVEFEVDVAEVSASRLVLTASGPVRMNVEYRVSPADGGAHVEASVALARGKGLLGGIMAGATGALLSGGALRTALGRIAAEVECGGALAA